LHILETASNSWHVEQDKAHNDEDADNGPADTEMFFELRVENHKMSIKLI
jgi:hypothetical protein